MKYLKIGLVTLIALFQWSLFGQTTDAMSAKTIDYSYLTEVGTIDFSGYTIDDYSKAFDHALQMKTDSLNVANVMKGNVVMSMLAKQINAEIVNHNLDSNARQTKDLLIKFRAQHYYVYLPEVSMIIKFFGYVCMGEYSHIYNVVTTNSKILPIVIFGVVLLCVVILHLFGKIKWKYKKLTNHLILVVFFIFVVLTIAFKLTCGCNVDEYSFYGIAIN